MPARLTVIITMYNSAPTIAETIDSLRRQTFDDWECLVVNDGSTDAGPEIVGSIIAQEPRIRMVTQANRGLAGARNRGIDECRTELVHFLDSDDWMADRGLEWLVAAAAETGASYGGYELCDDKGRSLGRQSPISAPIVGLNEQLEWNRTATHAHLFSRDAIGDCRFDEHLKVVEDYDMWLRLACRGEQWKAVERIVAGYRLRPNSMSKQFGAMCSCYETVVCKAFAEAERFGWADRGLDLGPGRFKRVVGNMALTYATMDALVDPSPNKGRAARMFDQSSRPERIGPALAANTASVALLFGACTAPDIDGWSETRWLVPLRQWWSRCADEGWMHPSEIDTALAELARKVIHPDTIADAMLDAAAACPPRPNSPHAVVIAGLEKNGRRLARRAVARGWNVFGFDDFSDHREPALHSPEESSDAGPRMTISNDPAELARRVRTDFAGAPWLIGAPDGPAHTAAACLTCLAAPDRTEHWSTHRDAIGRHNLELITDALMRRPAMAG
jgi:hypothetical protein